MVLKKSQGGNRGIIKERVSRVQDLVGNKQLLVQLNINRRDIQVIPWFYIYVWKRRLAKR